MHNLKKLLEQRSALIEKMDGMLAKLDEGGETRAFTDEELAEFNEAKSQVKSLTDTINAAEEQRSAKDFTLVSGSDDTANDNAEAETRSFEQFLRSGGATKMELRSAVNWTTSANGAVLPTTIANKIIDTVKEISPIFNLATHYNIGGTLTIPYYDESTNAITVAYAEEFGELESSAGQFKSISLSHYLVCALSKISKSLINNSNFPIVDYVVGKIAEKFALWIDRELIKGTSDKISGLSGITQKVTTAASTVITADELIDVQDMVPDVFQPNCVWIMSKKARSAIRKLKDGEGNYLLNKDATTKWGYTLFGRPVYISDAVDSIAAGKNPVYYGDFSGLAIKTSEGFSLELLMEKYATQHAVGAVGWMELDAKVENAQKMAALVMKTA